MIVRGHWFGVFNPRGELEAVEEGEDMARFVAANLSPSVDGRKHVNRAIRRVLVAEEEAGDPIVVKQEEGQ